MKVAIGIPTYNRLPLLRKTLESVMPLHPAIAIHVFDNCSTDGTFAGIGDYIERGVVFHASTENTGYVGNLNRVLGLSREYDWVGVLHSDDIYFCSCAKALLDALGKCEGAGLVYGASAVLNNAGEVSVPSVLNSKSWHAGDLAVWRAQRQIPCSSTFYSSSAIKIAGEYSAEFNYCADEEYNARIGKSFGIEEIPLWLSGYRKHEGHMMLATWRKPDFIGQFERMRLKMNTYLSPSAQRPRSHVRKELAKTLLGHTSALLALEERDVMASFYRYAFSVCPFIFLSPHYAARLLIHHTPILGGVLCRRLSLNQG